MLLILRCALTIGAIYALSPLRDPLPPPPAAAGMLARLWPSLNEGARQAIVDSATREAAERAAAALRAAQPPGSPMRP